MQQEIRFATFNLLNLAPPGVRLYDNLAPASEAQYEAKLNWSAQQIDLLDADVIGFQEVFAQDTLKQVLARTKGYRNATHVGFDPDPYVERHTPSVALVSRLPLVGPALSYPQFPAGVMLPPDSRDPDRFARPVLHASVQAAPGCVIDVLVVHLKSKRPDYRNGDTPDDPLLYAMACLRSLVWRGTEAVALRVMLSNMAKTRALPRIVLGDFNDVIDADAAQIVMGAGTSNGDRLFDAYQIAVQHDRLRHVAFSSIHEGHYSTIDHVLVSDAFNPACAHAIGQVLEVRYLNDHLALNRPDASDHGQVLARIALFERAAP